MLPGPVFNIELVTTARRARNYALRFFYGAILLVIVWQNDPVHYHWYYGATTAEMTLEKASELGLWLFRSFAVAQSIAVLLVTPAYVAGVIAEEKQRKTLHYLLASRLSSAEIVLGKLCARLLHVFVYLGVGLPVLSLISLFGGVEPERIVVTFVATLSTIFLVASFSILVSVYARRPREAIGIVYSWEVAWLFLPLLFSEFMPSAGWPWVAIYDVIRPVNDVIGLTGPAYALTRPGVLTGNMSAVFSTVTWMIGLQSGVGILCLILAVARLRPVFRKQGETGRLTSLVGVLKRGGRLLARPACGDDAMLWKERYVSRTSIATKVVSGVVVLILGAVIAYSVFDVAAGAFREVAEYGYGSTIQHTHRDELSMFVRVFCGFAYVAWALGVASAASSAIVHERESDTWISLIATPLDGHEIVRAKILGAVWGTRWMGFALLAFASLGLAAGAVHPIGYIAAIVETAVFIWFAAALGTLISLRSKNSGRAMTATVGILALLNGGYLLFCVSVRVDSAIIAVGVTPVLQAFSLVRYDELQYIVGYGNRSHAPYRYVESMMACIVGTIGYGVAALVLTLSSFGLFDEFAERPRRYGQYSPFPSPPDEWTEGAAIEFPEIEASAVGPASAAGKRADP